MKMLFRKGIITDFVLKNKINILMLGEMKFFLRISVDYFAFLTG